MRIACVKIKNFRSIESQGVELQHFCSIVGANNSGKSNFLEAIRHVLSGWLSVNTFSEDDVFGKDPKRDIEITLEFDEPILYRKYKIGEPQEVWGLYLKYTRYQRGDKTGERRLEHYCLDHKRKQLLVPQSAPKAGMKTVYSPLTSIPPEVRSEIPIVFLSSNRSLGYHLSHSDYSALKPLIEDIDLDFNDPNNTCEDGKGEFVARSVRFKRFLDEAMRLLNTDEYSNMKAEIQQYALELLGFDPEVDKDKLDFDFLPKTSLEFYKSLQMVVNEGSFKVLATELGYGYQNAIIMSILKTHQRRKKTNGIYLIEEPEMYMHPQMQRTMYSALQKLGDSNQVIVTTHSPHFVSVPDYESVVVVRKPKASSEFSFVTQFPEDKTKEVMNKEFDPARNELFFARKVLFVEGDTERLSIPEFAKRELGYELSRVNASVIEVGGKNNLPLFAEIAGELGITFGLLYDTDSDQSDKKEERTELNKRLDSYESKDLVNRVWNVDPKFETFVRRFWGEEQYQQKCEQYAGYSKVIKARLMASDPELKTPDTFKEIIQWLVS